MSDIDSVEELKKEYKKLARIYHPDSGGSTEMMQDLNEEFETLRRKLLKTVCGFTELEAGDLVFVNGTECRVTHVSEYAFIAKSKDTSRTAVFDKKTGFAVGNRKFRARLD